MWRHGRPGRTCRSVELTCEYDCDAIASEGDGESQGESVSAIACSGLGLSDADPAVVASSVSINSRRYGVSLSRYLAARSIAGCTHTAIAAGVNAVAGDKVCSAFVDFSKLAKESIGPVQERRVGEWLARWLHAGAVPVATLNNQRISIKADAWHHQSVFAVDAAGVWMCNPVARMPFKHFLRALCSPRTLLVRSEDALRCRPFDVDKCGLGANGARPPGRWVNVPKQAIYLLQRVVSNKPCPSHIAVPADYYPGVSLFALDGSEAARKISLGLARVPWPSEAKKSAPATTAMGVVSTEGEPVDAGVSEE